MFYLCSILKQNKHTKMSENTQLINALLQLIAASTQNTESVTSETINAINIVSNHIQDINNAHQSAV